MALAVAPVIIGHILDTTFTKSGDVVSYVTMTRPGSVSYHMQYTNDYVLAFRRILIGLLSLDAFAAVVLLIWMFASPRSLNK